MKLGILLVSWLSLVLVQIGLDQSDNKPQARTDLFGDPLPHGAIARLGTLRFRQGHVLAISPDGKLIATSYGGVIRLVDSQTGKDVRQGHGHESFVWCAAWSPDGKTIASGSRGHDRFIRLWDPATMKEVRRIPWERVNDEWGIEQIIFCTDGKTLLTRGVDHTIRMFDAVAAREIRRFRSFPGKLSEIVLAGDGKTFAALAVENNDGGWAPCHVLSWEVATGRQLCYWSFPDDIGLHAFSPDLKYLVTGLRNSPDKLKIWAVATGKIVRYLPIRPWRVAFSRDGKTLLADSEKAFSFWDVATGKETRRVDHGNKDFAFSDIVFCPDGKTLMSASAWDPLRFWDSASGKEVKRFEGHKSRIDALAFSADGKQLASAANNEIRLWSIAEQKQIHRYAGQVPFPRAIAFSTDAKSLISVSANHVVQFWDVSKGKEIRRQEGLGLIYAAVFSTNRKMLALWRENRPSVWDTKSLKICREWNHTLDWNYDALDIAPNGKTLATGGCAMVPTKDGHRLVGPKGKPEDYVIYLWDSDGAMSMIGKHPAVVNWVTFSPDGRTIASVDWKHTIRLWEKATGQLRAKWKTGDNVSTVRFSPNGRILASTNIGNYPGGHKISPDEDWDKVRLWDVATGKEIHRFAGHSGSIYALSFSPDGRLLASGSDDTTALVWDMEPINRKVKPKPVQLQDDQVKALWADLSGSDGRKAFEAISKLAASEQCLALIKKHAHPVRFADPEQVTCLVAELDSKQFATRQKADRELENLGVAAKPALRQALKKNLSEEMRRRLNRLLKVPEKNVPIAALRSVEILEKIGNAEAEETLKMLAGGVPDAQLTQEAAASLERLDRRPFP
jgi:WD40 repeat protein